MRCSESREQDTYIRLTKQFGKDGTIQWTALSCDILFLDKVVDEDAQDVVGVATLIGGFMSCNLKSELMLEAYPCTVDDLRKSLFLKLTPVMRYLM